MLSASHSSTGNMCTTAPGRGVSRYKGSWLMKPKFDYGTIGRMVKEQIHGLLQSPPAPKP